MKKSIENVEAFISKGKNRLKQNGNNVYLNDKDNFEIELFNPLTTPVMVKIKLNGEYISVNGLVLKPGMRYWLERFISDARKFVYETYDIDGGDRAAVDAIVNNGKVEIEFYNKVSSFNKHNLLNRRISGTQYVNGNNLYNPLTTTNINVDLYKSTTKNIGNNYQFDSLTSNSVTYSSVPTYLETGYIAQGEKSNQIFNETYDSFFIYPFYKIEWQIKPMSTQPVEVSDLANYCPNCGKKVKSTWNYCTSCGSATSL